MARWNGLKILIPKHMWKSKIGLLEQIWGQNPYDTFFLGHPVLLWHLCQPSTPALFWTDDANAFLGVNYREQKMWNLRKYCSGGMEFLKVPESESEEYDDDVSGS